MLLGAFGILTLTSQTTARKQQPTQPIDDTYIECYCNIGGYCEANGSGYFCGASAANSYFCAQGSGYCE